MNRIYQKEVTRKAPFSAGFSLTEVALVFLVAAAIIVAVTSGGALIENARVTKSYNDVSQFTIAIEKFYQKYKSLPGDMSDVSSLPGATPGNGNSVIDTADVDESRLFWQHLQLAGLISGSYSGGSSFVPGVDVPEGPIDNTGYTIVPNDKGEIIIRLSRFSNGADGLSVFTPEDAESLDSGADDGKPLTSTSRVRGVNGSDASGGNVCYTGSDETAVYNVGSDVASCMLDFVLNPYIEPQDSETVPCPRLGATRISDTRSCPLGYPGKIIEACRPSGWAVTDITCSAAKCSGERLYVYKDTRLESCADNHVGAVLRECSETGLWVDAVDQGDYVCTEDTSVCSVEGAGRILPCGQGYTGGIEQTCTSGNWVTGSDSCTAIACSLPTAKLGDTATATEITGTSASCSNNEIDSTVNTNYRCKKVDGTDCDSPTDGIVKACSMTGAAQGRWEIAANSCVSNSYATILPDGCDPAAAPINCPGCPNGSKGLGCPTGQTGQNNFRCITVNSNGDTAWEPLGNNTCRPLSCGDFAVGSVRQSQKFSCPDAMAGEVYEVCNICEVGEPCYTQDNANRGKALWELNFSNCAPACSGAADNAGYAHWPNADAGDSGVRSVACMEGYYGVAVRNCSSVPASGGLHAHGKWSEPSKSCFQPPFSLTGLAFWVDANNDASIQTSQGGALANDQNVATWYDMSGNGVNMSNDSDNTRPWYKPAGNGINGRPAIFFNSNDELHAPDTTKLGFERTDDFSVFVVNKDSIIKNNSALLSKMVSGGTHTGWDVGYDGSDAFKSFLINDWGASPKRGINIRVSRNVAVNEPNILGFLYDGSSNAAGMSYYFNGYKMAVAAEENNLSTSIITAARFRLGARGVDGALGNYFTGYIGEVLIYETALSDSKRRQVEEYLATKWEIPIAPKFSDIDGLTLWLDATDTDGDFDPDTNPTTISSWFDKGPYRNHVANTGGTLYRTASGINGKQSISFNGASNNMNFAISPFDTGNVGYTAIVALQVNSLTNSYSNSNSIFFTGGSGNNTRAFFRVAASGAFVHGWGDGSGNGNSTYDLFTTAGTAKANTPYIFTSIYEPSEATKVGRRIYVNGVESAYSPSTALNMATGAGQIGRGNGGQNLRGFLGELMTYNRALNDDEREAVEQYLSAKWGIAIPWTPKDMTGLTAWWDGDNIGSLYKSGNITTWKDKSGNGNDNWRNTATATAHPFPSKIGSRGAIGFDGADQFNHQSGAAPLGNNAHSFFVVAQPTVQATDGPLAHFYCGTNCNASQLSISTAGLLQITDSTNSLRLVSSTNFANRVMLVSVIADGAETSVYVDGSKKLALDVTLPTTTTTDFAVGGAYIGGNYRYYNGKVGEILVFNRAVSDTERQTVEAYLGAKWPIGETWAPTRIPGLQLWLDADDSSSVVIQSDVVTQWNNKATELAALTHVTGNAGVTWVQNAKNGRAVMNFNGSSYFVSNTTMVPKTLTMVHKTPNGGCNGNSCWLMEFLGVSNTHIKAYGDKEEFYGAFLTYPHYVNGQIQRLGGRPPRVFNNTYQVTTFVMDNPSSSSGTFYLKTNASLNNIAPGQVAEVLVWNRNITTAERLQVEAYLSEKWGVPVSRPNTNSPAYGLQGLALWLDAADTVTIATPRNDGQSTDNDDVGPPAWANKGNIVYNSAISGLNNNGAFSAVQQEVANQPTYQQAGLGIDRPSFRFDGVNDSINVPNFSMYPVMTAFVVGDFAASPAASTMMIEHGAIISGGATDGFFMWGGSNAFYQRRSSTNYVISGQPNGWHGSSTTVITAYNDASTLGYYVNDSLPTGQTAIATASSGGNGLTTATLTIGNHSVDTTFKTIGDIGEILIYDRYLPATERKIVEDYLVNKWVNGITADSVVNGVGATQGITSWFDAADTTHMTVDGSNKISQVNDIKTATPKYNSLQSNASARPTYVPNVQNGNGVMRFDGVDDVLTLENDDTSDALTLAEVIGSAAATEDSDFTVMSVLSLANATENDAFPTSNQMVFGVASATGNVGLAARANSTRLVGFSISDGQVYQSTKEVSLGTFYVTALYQGAGSLYFDVNGVNISKQPAEAIRSDLDAAAFMVGGGNTNKPFKGDIGEFITFSKMLPQNAREQIESYLGGKWGIPITTGADGASSFTDPTSVNGLTLWLDADDASTINGGGTLAEGTSVTTWSDKSDNNFDFCSGGSCSTTAVTYTPNIVNGKPAIKFTGTSQTLRSAESIKTLRFTNNNQGSVFIVSRVDSLGRINFAWQNANGNTDRYLISFPHSSNNIFYDFGYCCTENVGRLTKVAPSSIVDNWTVMSAIRSPDNKGMVYSNGELLVLGTMTQDLDVDESSYFYFGKNSVDSNAQDYYAEMLLYNVAISDTDRENIENYLMTKWGIGSGAGNDAAYLNDPSDLNGLTVWLDAADSSTLNSGLPTNGGEITTVSNKADNANIPSFSKGTNGPTYNLSGANGKPVLNFSGSGQELRDLSVLRSHLFESNQVTAFFVQQVTSETAINSSTLFWGSGNTNRLNMEYPSTHAGGTLIFDFGVCCTIGQGRQQRSLPSDFLLDWHILTSIKNSSNVASIYMDGLPIHSGAMTNSSADITTPLYIGSRGGGAYFKGNIAEILVYRYALSDNDRTKVEAYLASKWLSSAESEPSSDAAGLTIWLDAADASTLNSGSPTNGAEITLWANKAANVNIPNFSKGTNGPTYNASGLNGKPVLNFGGNGATQSMTTASILRSHFAETNQISMFVVQQAEGGASFNSSTLFWQSTDGNRRRVNLHLPETSGLKFDFGTCCSSGARIQTSSVPSNFMGQWHVLSAIKQTSNTGNLYMDGLSVVSGGLSESLADLSAPFYIGRADQAASYFFNGNVAEIMVYRYALDDTQRKTIEKYLMDKWLAPDAKTPDSVGNLALWLDGDDSSTLFANAGCTTAASNGGTVGCWKDKSSNGFNATQSSGSSMPDYKTSVMNGRSALRFNGSSDHFTLGSNYIFSSSNGLTMFAVAKNERTAGDTGFIYNFGFHGNTSYSLGSSHNAVFLNTPSDFGGGGITTQAYYNPIVITGEIIFGKTQNLYVNSDLVASGGIPSLSRLTTAEIVEFATRQDAGGPVTIGFQSKTYNQSLRGFQGDIAEILVYTSALSTSDRLSIESYLKNKWGIASSEAGTITNPETPESLVLWLDASDADTINNGAALSDYSALTEWRDKSQYGDRAVRFRTSGDSGVRYRPTALNGKPTMVFDSIPLQIENSADKNITTAGTWFIVAQTDSANATQASTLLAKGTDTGAVNFALRLGLSDASGQRFCSGATPLTCAAATNATGFTAEQPYVMTYRYKAGTPGKADFFKNGGYQGSFSASNVTAANSVAAASGATKIMLGAKAADDVGAYSEGFYGGISEVLMYNYYVDDGERKGVENYLMSKWGMLNVPLTVSGLTLWLDAADANTINGGNEPSTGQAITAWADKSTTGLHMSASGGRVRYGSGSSQLLNGKPVMAFTSGTTSGTGFISNSAVQYSKLVNSNEMTAFGVLNVQANAGSLYWWENGERINIHIRATGMLFDFGLCCSTTTNASRFVTGATPEYYNNWWVMMTSRKPGAGNVSVELDSNARSIVYQGYTGDVITATGTDNLEIGSFNNGASLMKGHLAEVLIFRRDLSLAEKTKIRRYLGAKWGIAVR